MKTLIQGGYVVGFNGESHEILRDGVVVVEDDAICFVGFSYDEPVDKTVDARGKLICPGFVNSHMHAGSNAGEYFLNDPDKTDYFASNYLTYFTPRKGAKGPAGLQDFRVSGKFSLIQAVKSGSTTLQVHGGGLEGGDEFADMAGELGLRAYLAPSYRSVNFYYEESGALRYVWDDAIGERGLQGAVDFIKKHRGRYDGRIQGMLYPRQPDTCTPELLRSTKDAAKDLGVRVHIHAAINLIEFHTIINKYAKTPIAFLNDIGFLGPEVILAHCIFLTGHSWTALPRGDDLQLIVDAGTTVAHSPMKYARLGITMESFDRYVARGVNVALGTDCFPLDMIHEMRITSLATRFAEKDYLAGAYRHIFDAATVAGAKALGRDDLGKLCTGAKADLLIIDMQKTGYYGAIFDPIKALIELGSGRDIETVMIDGKIVVDQYRFLGVDEEELLAKVQEEAENVWKKVPEWDFMRRRADQISPWAFPLKEE